MTSLRQTVKNAAPSSLWKVARKAFFVALRLPELPGAYLHPLRRESMRKLEALKDIHRGERCFIIGNGPSLRQTDISRLRGEITFGMNRIYMAFPDWGFTTTYYVAMNDLVIEQCAADIQALSIPKFLTWRARRFVRPAGDMHFIYSTYTDPKFATDVSGRVWEGATVTYVAMQIAFHMGFHQVILIGVDHNFATQGKPNATVISQGDDPNHFNPNYFGKGFRWQLPDLETSEMAYRMAHEAYKAAGREILDATVGGRLTVFPKVDYNRLLDAHG